ncbi:unnamed protein product [Adineta steineri]|uniref:NAD(P)(+)--arginine ADP-ribosyltransferase n=1 Tax=Adineta steineri TaxID=433720 RepID=A0A819DB95_9BILA|nr:unnamed protein product [Adineta steineri]CAF3834570.1 unnamed protein product [Adineta steineri]
MPHLDSIYIFCGNKLRHQGWAENWTKIKGVHTNIKDICQALQLTVKQCDQDTIPVSFHPINAMASLENLNQLEPTFMYTQLFKDILLDMKHNKHAIQHFIAYCRRYNCVSSIHINCFEKEYYPQLAIWWYTSPSNIYSMLNDALRTLNVDKIITMGFFICHLHQQIQQLYGQQVNSYGRKPFIVYRGQGLHKLDFEKLQKTNGGLMSFNNFLSTSKDKEVSLEFARRASKKLNMVGILFIMSIDPSVKSTLFASIKEESYFKKEDEVLFSMHTVFRVSAIKPMDNKNEFYQVELELTSDDDQQVRVLTDRIREEAGDDTGWQRLGHLLFKMGHFNKAEKLYNVLLKHTSDGSERALYYNQLGFIHSYHGNYAKAVWYYEKTLEIEQKILSSNDPDLGSSYTNIGTVYSKMGDYLKALSFYEKALSIWQKAFLSNHPSLGSSYNNTGSVYDNMGDYLKALSFYEKALSIWQKTLPSNHPHFASSYNNIGSVYYKMGECSKALSSHKKALEIQQMTLPLNHPDLANSYNNIGSVYNKMGEYYEALSFYYRALRIREKTLPSNHRLLATSYNNIGGVYENMRENTKALSYYERALEVYQKILPSDHSDLANSYNNIGSVYDSMAEYPKALSFYDRALEIREKTLPSSHPDLAISNWYMGSVFNDMEDYSKALLYFERALNVWQSALPPTHPHIKTVKESIEIVTQKL